MRSGVAWNAVKAWQWWQCGSCPKKHSYQCLSVPISAYQSLTGPGPAPCKVEPFGRSRLQAMARTSTPTPDINAEVYTWQNQKKSQQRITCRFCHFQVPELSQCWFELSIWQTAHGSNRQSYDKPHMIFHVGSTSHHVAWQSMKPNSQVLAHLCTFHRRSWRHPASLTSSKHKFCSRFDTHCSKSSKQTCYTTILRLN